MEDGWINVQTQDEIALIELNGPPVNALTAARLEAFAETVEGVEARALVIASSCKVLSAGMDLTYAQRADTQEQAAIVAGLNRAFLSLFAAPVPVVCAAHGSAIAGGLFFVLAADWRIAGQGAQFGLAEIRVGVDFPAGPLGIAQAVLGPVEARRLMLTGQPIGAAAAVDRGIVDEVCAPDAVRPAAIAKAAALAGLPDGAYARVKAQLRAADIAAITAACAADAGTTWINDAARAAMQRMLAR